MKKIIFTVLILTLSACKNNSEIAKAEIESPITDNTELQDIYNQDQLDRRTDAIDWNVVSKRDSLREQRVYEMLDSSLVRSSQDFENAAMVFQHGGDSVAYGMAVKLMRKAVELDSTRDKWLLAAAIDRNLLSRDQPQIYGTQYMKIANGPYERSKMDTTQISDATRREFGVEILAEQKEKERQLNLKSLSSLLQEGKSVDAIISFIKDENLAHSKYDISEDSINTFGYQLLEAQPKEALKIFKLNTELYPEASNPYDSYGETLMTLGETENAITAYKKALELDPENDHAREIIETHKK